MSVSACDPDDQSCSIEEMDRTCKQETEMISEVCNGEVSELSNSADTDKTNITTDNSTEAVTEMSNHVDDQHSEMCAEMNLGSQCKGQESGDEIDNCPDDKKSESLSEIDLSSNAENTEDIDDISTTVDGEIPECIDETNSSLDNKLDGSAGERVGDDEVCIKQTRSDQNEIDEEIQKDEQNDEQTGVSEGAIQCVDNKEESQDAAGSKNAGCGEKRSDGDNIPKGKEESRDEDGEDVTKGCGTENTKEKTVSVGSENEPRESTDAEVVATTAERVKPDLLWRSEGALSSTTSLTSEDSVTPDSSSECDIEVDIAIVTERKTKKPTLAAIVKDEHGGGKLLVEALSDAARFSYCSVCAVSLGNLFENEWDRDWRKQSIELILNHLKLPDQCNSAMYALMDGMGGESMHAFVDTLLKDPVLQKNTLLLPEDLVTLALQNGVYDARMRVLIFHVAWHLRIRWRHLEKFEEILVKMIKQQSEETEEQKKEREKKEKKKKRKRYALIGLATVGGGAAIGLTAGLAAPFIAAGLGAIIGTSAAAALTTTAGIAIMTSLFGAAGAGLTGYKMKKRVGAIEQFEFSPLTHGNHLHVAIAISGWLTDEQPDNFHRPWVNLAISKEQYYLLWESKYLLDLGRALEYLLQSAVTMATQEALKYTILSGLLAALAWPAAVLSVASVIDNPWGVAMQRAKEVGRQLAEVLISKQQGNRPVTLIGFSLGAKVIYNCLEEMSQREGCEGLIEEVILLGTPAPASASHWSKFKRVVAGRIINGYCRGDWLLRFVYRTASAQISIAGLQPIPLEDRRMVNVDLSDVVSGHLDYAKKMDTILRIIGVSVRDQSSSKLVKEDLESKKKSEDDENQGPVHEETGVVMDTKLDAEDAEEATEAFDDGATGATETVDGLAKSKENLETSVKQTSESESESEDSGGDEEKDIANGFAFQDNWYSVVPE
ncbi:transmembrane and coiled-coil domain-containing protein 4-like [Ptychodera flava]|uniref:transmembrane and coiled-coil domain-containing protein 4-like n=1 Tax=Ptychodera flava TaxID=63121 RepID=UPI00396A9CDE